MTTKTRIACEMENDCENSPTHIDEKGFIYCQRHGDQRKQTMRCRRMTLKEMRTILKGEPITSYEKSSLTKNVDYIDRFGDES